MFEHLKISGLLSFPEVDLELRPLNVIIGPNGAGKSNLLEIFFILSKIPTGFWQTFKRQGLLEWFWKGEATHSAVIEITTRLIRPKVKNPCLWYGINFHPKDFQEILKQKKDSQSRNGKIFIDTPSGKILKRQYNDSSGRVNAKFVQLEDWGSYEYRKPVMEQLKDKTSYPEIFYLSDFLKNIHFYREWNLGRNALLRTPQPTDELNNFLYEDASNLALVLNFLDQDGTLKRIEKELSHFFERAERISVQIAGGMAQLFLREKGMEKLIPATRLSDGTIRYLCLLSILLHPNPPPVICMEEPELGLHPDMIRRVAELMKEASERTQLIVTTHSTELVDALSDDPESVVVCERSPEHGGSEFRRLDGKALEEWLQDYSLGQLWRKGEIGGNRF